MPRNSSVGVPVATAAFMKGRSGVVWGRYAAPPHHPFLLAVLRVGAVADVLLLQVAVEQLLVVRLRDRDRLEDVRRNADRLAGGLRGLALEQGDGRLRGVGRGEAR